MVFVRRLMYLDKDGARVASQGEGCRRERDDAPQIIDFILSLPSLGPTAEIMMRVDKSFITNCN